MLIEAARSLGFYEQIISMFDGNNDNSVYLEKKNSLAVNELFEVICNSKEPLERAGAFINMINILWENTHSPVWQDEMLSVIFEAINNHIGDEFSLDILSSETNTDKYYLCHYFKSKTGMTIFDYLKCQRIEMAKKLLVENDTSISQIANACGYNSLAYFSKCFKEATGMTPKEYVKSVL
jgi:YesN/AraC family two-component response regulator